MSVKKIAVYLSIAGMAAFVCFSELQAQDSDDLYVFGFAQTIFNHKNVEVTAFPNEENNIPFLYAEDPSTNSFSLHQLNLFFRKTIDDKTTFFLNIEATGSFSTENQSGNFKISEGWISHYLSEHYTIKAGLLLPTFNNLNEISNRLPLFPYIVRPIIYESLLGNLLVSEDYLPRQGYLQLKGNYMLNTDLILDLALQVGNAESSYHSTVVSNDLESAGASSIYRGENLSEYLAVSGRIGISNYLETFKAGISGSFDYDNKTEPQNESIARIPLGVNLPAFGDIPRYRLGLDLSFKREKLEFESEFIGVFHDHSSIHRTLQYRSADLDKIFYYGLINYNWTNRFYSYTGWSHIHDNTYEFILKDSPDHKGINLPTAGIGWKTSVSSSIKAQWTQVRIDNNPHLIVYMDLFTVGVSIIF